MATESKTSQTCPDSGICHHMCEEDGNGCFRVGFCGPLSGVFPNNEWPQQIVEQEQAKRRG